MSKEATRARKALKSRNVPRRLHGAKGSKPPSQRVPVESPNTLRSKSRGRIIDLIAHGPVVGLVNGLKSIYLEDTPLQDDDGNFNFEGVTVYTREGYPDQEYIPGFAAAENVTTIGQEILFDTPIVRTITNTEADAVIVTVQLQALSEQKENGDLVGYQVKFTASIRQNGGAWTELWTNEIVGKTVSPYQESYRIPLKGEGPFDIRLSRPVKESEESKINDAVYWAMMTEVIDGKLNYPDSVLVALDVDAELFGSQLPERSYDMKLSIIQVPSNYDPNTRKYTGIWDGTFKSAWSDNPAWCFYDLATHPIIGAGNTSVDKWVLYRIGQYCDQLVPDGYGGMEPRFTCNTIFSSQEEAITTLDTLASVFRGMVYWGSDSVVAVGDMPGDAIKLVTPANITSDGFEYTGTSLRERHSVCLVMWNDPENNYKQVPELVEDAESIQLFGWRQTEVTAACCTSRGQARRLGKWILYSERMETQTVTYTAATDHSDLRPGDFIRISDPDRAGGRFGGRVKTSTLTKITLDRKPPEATGGGWIISVIMPDGSIAKQTVSSFTNNVANLAGALPALPLKGAVWVLSGATLETPMFRVVSVSEETEGLNFRITATEHDPNKYNIVEYDLHLPTPPDSLLPSGTLPPPTNLSLKPYKYISGGNYHQAASISWTPPKDARAEIYVLEALDPDDVGYRTLYSGSATSFDELDVIAGQWMLRVRAVTSTGRVSEWATLTTNMASLLLPAPPDSVEVEAATFSVTLTPHGNYPGAYYEFWRSEVALESSLVTSNAIRRGVAMTFVDAKLKPDTQYFYYVRGTNIYGFSDFFPVQAKTLRDFDDIIKAVDEDIRKPGGLFDEMTAGVNDAVDQANQAALDAAAALEAAQELVPRIGAVEDGVTNLGLSDAQQAIQIAAVQTTTEGFSALVSTETATRVLEDGVLGSRIGTVEVSAGENTAAIHDNDLAIATLEQSMSNRTSALEANFTALDLEMTSRMTTEETVRSTETGALSTRLNKLESSVGENISARVTTVETTLATATESVATKITELESTMDDQYANIQQTYSTKAYADGAVARAVTTVTVNGKKAVFGISVDNEIAEIGAVADRFYIYNPYGGDYTLAFAVEDGVTIIRDALIRNASITMAKIADSLQSDNYVPGMQGWRLSKSGIFEINGSGAGEGQLVQTNQTISVYDGTGNLRVQLGKLN